MATVTSALPDEARRTTGDALQGALVDLIDLSLLGKQAHWNLRGRNFRSVHLQLDEVVDLARAHMDTVAERAVAIGVNPDGRPRTVADTARSPGLDTPPGDPGPDALFSPTVYVRGALTLHVLRHELGDEAFFRLLRTWVDRYGGGSATSADFEALAEEVAARDLGALFDAWLRAPALPPH